MRAHRQDLAVAHVPNYGADEELRRALATTSASLGEVLSVWPPNQRDQLVLWARLENAGGAAVGARTRGEDFAARTPELAHELRQIRGDVPVVIDLTSGRTVVVPWREAQALGRS